MDWEVLQKILVGVLSVFTIIATALVGILFGSLKTLRDTANDLRARVQDLEKERVEDKASLAANRAENDILKSMITGKVEWVALTDQLEDHHKQALQWWSTTDGHFNELPDSIKKSVEAAVKASLPSIIKELKRS